VARYRKGFNDINAHVNRTNNPEELFDLTMNNLLDGFYDYALDSSNEGKFKAICLSGFKFESNAGDGPDQEQFMPAGGTEAGQFMTIIVRPLQSFADSIPDPKNAKDPSQLIRFIAAHKVFTAVCDQAGSGEEATKIPAFGQIVDCYYEYGSVSKSNYGFLKWSPQDIETNPVPTYRALQSMEGTKAAADAFAKGAVAVLGSEEPTRDISPIDNAIKEYAIDLPPVGSTDLTVGIDESKVKKIAEEQLNFWKGKKAKATGPEGGVLTTYWRLQGYEYKAWAWSAVFVSFVLQTAETGFPGQISHYKYMRRVINEPEKGWKAFSLTKTAGTKISIGDVLINPRTKTLDRSSDEYYYSHGDVVYKIEGGYAYLCGGNLSNTAKVAAKIKVDSNNIATNFYIYEGKEYMVILKKVS